MILSEILVPLLNANEPEARLVAIHVRDGQAVEKGALLFTLETTKATTDLQAPEAGFIRLLANPEQSLSVGEKLACITSNADDEIPPPRSSGPSAAAPGLRMTRPARALVESLGLDPGLLPSDRLVTEKIVREIAAGVNAAHLALPESEKPYLLIYGGGGHAKALLDLVLGLDKYAIAGILDDSLPAGQELLGVPILGTRALLPILHAQGVRLAANGVGGILDIHVRVRIFELLQTAGFEFPALVHNRATVESSAEIGVGVQVFANAYIGSGAVLQERCMVNTSAVISHDCSIGAFSHIAPGALLAGHVHVGKRTLIGMGVTTAIGVHIGDGVRVGNSAILLADVPDRTIIQAGRFWTGRADAPS